MLSHSFGTITDTCHSSLHTTVPYEKFKNSLEDCEDSNYDQSPKIQKQDRKEIYTPVILSVK